MGHAIPGYVQTLGFQLCTGGRRNLQSSLTNRVKATQGSWSFALVIISNVTRMAKNRYPNPDEYPGDRMTVTVHKGYKRWFKNVALELNSDVSKIHRDAL